MARKQAKRRKQTKQRRIRMPAIPFGRIASVVAAVGVIVMTYHFSMRVLDHPIDSITIEGPFQRVSALHIEEAISDELQNGFLSANLSVIQGLVIALPWIDRANVERRWPAEIKISVTEQVPAACWGERGLLNTRGELFVTDVRHVPAELPRLSGPEEQSGIVAMRYLEIREQLIPIGLDVRRVHVDARGSWEMTLQNGVEVRLGRRDIEQRTHLFLDIVANIVSSREADIEFVDMRYSNGFTIGWRNGAKSPAASTALEQKMMAGRLE